MKDFITKEIKEIKETLKFHKSIVHCLQDKEFIIKLEQTIYAYESILRFINKDDIALSKKLKLSLFTKTKLQIKSWYYGSIR